MKPKPPLGRFAWTADNAEQAKKVIARYPEGRQASAVMALLDLAQRQVAETNTQGWLPVPVMEYIADQLEMPYMRVYEVATFYTMYNRAGWPLPTCAGLRHHALHVARFGRCVRGLQGEGPFQGPHHC